MAKRAFIIMKRLAAVLTALLLCAGALPARAAGAPQAEGFDPGPEARLAADWLAEALPAPGAADAAAALALLRSGQLAATDPWMEAFCTALDAQASGGAEEQETALAAWQVMALAAGGRAVPAALADALAPAVARGETDAAAMARALLALALAGEKLPWGQGSLEDAADRLAALANGDGGFGAQEGGDPLTTALVLQALALYRGRPAVDACVEAALAYLENHATAYGGFNMQGAPSAVAAAQVTLALDCLGGPAVSGGIPAPEELVRAFQDETGGFAANPDAEPDTALTAVCLLALAAGARQGQGLPPVYAFGAAQAPPAVDGQQPEDAQQEEGGWRLPALGAMPAWGVLAIVGGVLAAVVALAIPVARRQRRKQQRRLRLEGAGHSGTGTAPKKPAYKAGGKGGKGGKPRSRL